jgi:hypothetical protein
LGEGGRKRNGKEAEPLQIIDELIHSESPQGDIFMKPSRNFFECRKNACVLGEKDRDEHS